MNYTQAVEYIRSKSWRDASVEGGPERVKELLKLVGNPEKCMKFVHIAGTNGKGSVAAMSASILRKGGYKIGLFTSPSIQHFNERMQINGEMISETEFAKLVSEEIKPNVEKMINPTSEFEMITCLALLWFKNSGCDIAVIEVGMGGEYDSTNVIPCPEVAVICAIGLDHTAELGNTIGEIACAKAGIIKHGCDVVINGNSDEANEVFRAVCEQRSATITIPDYTELTKSEVSIKGQYFDYKHYNALFIPLIGDYQPQNAAVAIETVLVLKQRGFLVTDLTIREGLHDVNWPARFELVHEKPTFIVDGGHNAHGILGTVKSIKRFLADQKPIIIIGLMADKDIDSILQMLCEVADSFVTVTPSNSRAINGEALCEKLHLLGKKAKHIGNIEQAIKTACVQAGESGAVVALGSLYFAGMVRGYFGK